MLGVVDASVDFFQGENVSRDVGGTVRAVSEKRLLGSHGPS